MMTTGISVGMGSTVIEPRPGRIPFTAIDTYARRYELDGESFDLFLGLLEPLDREFLDWERERAAERAAELRASAARR
jgi:hypothetical protein